MRAPVKYEAILSYSIVQAAAWLRTQEVSPVELTRDCLKRIEKRNPALNAFITVTADSALAQARVAEEEIRRGDYRGPLHGIPLGLKDMIDTAGVSTTAGSELYKNRIPVQDAEVVRRLKAAGAVLLGKQNLHEFAYGCSSVIGFFGEVHNPWNTSRIAGGSSGGSAAAVSAGLCLAAIGTDTAGSIRLPAAYCGVVGLKPTYERISRKGVIPLSPSLDHVGPITGTVEDCALVLNAVSEPVARPVETQPLRRLRVGVPRKFFFEVLHSEIASAVERALDILKPRVAELREITLTVDTDRTLQAAESFWVHEESVRKEPHLYQPETLGRIKSGEKITRPEYERSLKTLERDRREIAKVFENVDLIVTPTAAVPPASLEELKRDRERLRPRELLMLRNTRPFNVWGIPAISVPCGFTSDGLPIGLQIAGPPGREDLVFAAARVYESAAPKKAATWD